MVLLITTCGRPKHQSSFTCSLQHGMGSSQCDSKLVAVSCLKKRLRDHLRKSVHSPCLGHAPKRDLHQHRCSRLFVLKWFLHSPEDHVLRYVLQHDP